MALTVPNEGEVVILKRLLNKEAGTSLVLDLFSNDVTPNSTTNLASFTFVATGNGYAANTIANTAWTVTPGNNSVGASFANAAAVVFTFTGVPTVNTVYGYVLHTATEVIAAERLPVGVAPFVISAAGETVSITPVITAASVTND